MKENSVNIDFEKVISSLNDSLYAEQNSLYKTVTKDETTVHVIGAPRSGTTLLTQLILSNFDIGYISNLTAAFWKAPVYGVYLTKKLLGEQYVSDFTSTFGRTSGVSEPHEFSYFWKHHLRYPDFLQRTHDKSHTIDWEALKTAMYQMCLAFEKAMVYKSFQFGFHAAEAVRNMPSTIFLLIERELYQNAYSIYKLRKNMHNDVSIWASIKPHQFSFLKNENIYRQIMGQILFLNYEYKKQFESIPKHNKLVLTYHDLCFKPELKLKEISEKINHFTPKKITYNLENSMNKVHEQTSTIPKELLEGFKEAENWLIETYPELKK